MQAWPAGNASNTDTGMRAAPLCAVGVGVLIAALMARQSGSRADLAPPDLDRLHAVIIGGTGAIGQHLVRATLRNTRFSRVTTVGRREVDVSADAPDGADMSKLHQVVVDMDGLADAQVWSDIAGQAEGGTTVFCALGTTRGKAGGSAAGFRKVDYGYVRAAAEGAKRAGASHFSLVTAAGAAKVWYGESRLLHPLLYTRTKWDAQQAVIEQGFRRVSIFQPGLLNREAPGADRRPWEALAVRLVPSLHVRTVADAMVADATTSPAPAPAGGAQAGGGVAYFSNADMTHLAAAL